MDHEMAFGMASFGLWQLVAIGFWLALFLVPAWRITQKAGFHGALSLLVLIPVVNLIMIWVFAFVPWPGQRRPAEWPTSR